MKFFLMKLKLRKRPSKNQRNIMMKRRITKTKKRKMTKMRIKTVIKKNQKKQQQIILNNHNQKLLKKKKIRKKRKKEKTKRRKKEKNQSTKMRMVMVRKTMMQKVNTFGEMKVQIGTGTIKKIKRPMREEILSIMPFLTPL